MILDIRIIKLRISLNNKNSTLFQPSLTATPTVACSITKERVTIIIPITALIIPAGLLAYSVLPAAVM